MSSDFLIVHEVPLSYSHVEWEDSDSSEDEDYLPQRDYHKPIFFNNNSTYNLDDEEEGGGQKIFNRMNQSVWATIDQLNRIKNETPSDKVRRVIDFTIDNGTNKVDFSHLNLTEIPSEIQELKYLTTIQNSVVKSTCLQIYLYSNQLQVVNPALFELKNLTVLSLRDNKLKTLPPQIGLLENLIELSVGNNQLEVLPAEILRLRKLTNLALNPNPLLPISSKRQQQVSVSSLVEITMRYILTTATTTIDLMYIPTDIVDKVNSVSLINSCEKCYKRFYKPSVELIDWKDDFLGNLQVPLLYRFCSTHCCNQFF